MTIFDIVNTLEMTSGCVVAAYVSNSEVTVFFKYKAVVVKHVFTEEEVNQFDINHWSTIGGSVKLKFKSQR